tara:strand:+ start:4455 stop:4808 length:354 start_codon:yes stop_codon:yes gene_type:complete
MDDDSFFLGWLARECRFEASVHFAPRTRIGYRIVRRIKVSPKDEPALNMWLSTKGITARIIKDKEQILKVIVLLRTASPYIKDQNGMKRMLTLLDTKRRRVKHQEIINAINLLDTKV